MNLHEIKKENPVIPPKILQAIKGFYGDLVYARKSVIFGVMQSKYPYDGYRYSDRGKSVYYKMGEGAWRDIPLELNYWNKFNQEQDFDLGEVTILYE